MISFLHFFRFGVYCRLRIGLQVGFGWFGWNNSVAVTFLSEKTLEWDDGGVLISTKLYLAGRVGGMIWTTGMKEYRAMLLGILLDCWMDHLDFLSVFISFFFPHFLFCTVSIILGQMISLAVLI